MGGKHINWTKEMLNMLGTASDKELGRMFSISSNSVKRKREELRIPLFEPADSWTEGMIALLGTLSDQTIADRFGLSRSVVLERRQALGIESARPEHSPARKNISASKKAVAKYRAEQIQIQALINPKTEPELAAAWAALVETHGGSKKQAIAWAILNCRPRDH